MTEITATPEQLSIELRREFDAPVALVWRCHTEPDLLARWLGPDRLSCRVDELDVRHGGRWAFTNVDTDGSEYDFRGVFHGEPSPDLCLRTFEWLGLPGHVSFETLRMTALDGDRTLVHATSVFQSVEDRDGMAATMGTGVDQGYAKLDRLLGELRG